MKYDKAGEYTIKYKSTDECGNETVEERQVLVAREIQAGEHITLEQDGDTIIINGACCDKEELLAILGYEEVTISKTDVNGESITVKCLGYVVEE